jgi:hypothetical protein
MEDVWTPDYAAHWQPTAAIWDATDAVYFDRTRFPTGLSIEALRAHPMEHRGCGLYGAPYDQFAEGQVDTRSYLFADAFRRMLLGHCEFVPELLEFGAAYRLGGHVLTDHPRIGVARLPLSPRPDMPEKFTPDGRYPLYIYLRKGFPDSRGLVERLNATIASWHRTGKDRAVMSRYIDLALLEQR